jgi:hypothetical protein
MSELEKHVLKMKRRAMNQKCIVDHVCKKAL